MRRFGGRKGLSLPRRVGGPEERDRREGARVKCFPNETAENNNLYIETARCQKQLYTTALAHSRVHNKYCGPFSVFPIFFFFFYVLSASARDIIERQRRQRRRRQRDGILFAGSKQ